MTIDTRTNSASESLPSALPWRAALAGAMIMAAAIGIGRFAYTPLLPPMQDALGWSVSEAGDVAAANFLGYMLGAMMAAYVGRAAGTRSWLMSGIVLSIATTGAGGFVTAYPVWLAIRFLSGVASAFCLVLATAIVIDYLANRGRPQWGALHFAGVGTGVVLSVVVIECLRVSGFDASQQWLGLGIASLLLFTVAWVTTRRLPVPVHRPEDQTSPVTSGQSVLVRLIIAYGLFGFGYIVTATFIVAMARDLGHSPWVEPVSWVVFGLIAVPSVLFWQKIAQRSGLFRALRIAFVVEALGVLMAGYGTSQIALVAGGALLGGTFMGITALGLVAARRISTGNQSRAIGWMTAAFGLGQLLGPAVAGRLADASGGFQTPSLLAAVLLIAGVILLRSD